MLNIQLVLNPNGTTTGAVRLDRGEEIDTLDGIVTGGHCDIECQGLGQTLATACILAASFNVTEITLSANDRMAFRDGANLRLIS